MSLRVALGAACLSAAALAASAGPSAAAQDMRPCGWQGIEEPWPLAADGPVSVSPLAPGAARLQLERATGLTGVEYCGGVVLSESWVLTARHCVEGKVWRDFRVVAGAELLNAGGVERHVKAAYCAGRAGGNAIGTDIALLWLAEPLPANVPHARLASLSETGFAPLAFAGVIASWPVRYRSAEPQPLMLSRFSVASRDPSGFFRARPLDFDGSTPCSGESGSAFWQDTPGGPVVRGVLSSVSSPLTDASAREICRSADMLALITDTAPHYAWIRETMDICESLPGDCALRP